MKKWNRFSINIIKRWALINRRMITYIKRIGECLVNKWGLFIKFYVGHIGPIEATVTDLQDQPLFETCRSKPLLPHTAPHQPTDNGPPQSYRTSKIQPYKLHGTQLTCTVVMLSCNVNVEFASCPLSRVGPTRRRSYPYKYSPAPENPNHRLQKRQKKNHNLLSFSPFVLFRFEKMAQISSVSIALLVVLAMTVFTVSAQEISPSPAPAAGSGFSLPVSGSVVGFSLVLSLMALLKH